MFCFLIGIIKKDVKGISQGDFNKDSILSEKTILIVEDDIFSSEIIERYLEKTNVEIIKVLNGKDAVEICKKNKQIDLVLMDINMPKLNGLQQLRK